MQIKHLLGFKFPFLVDILSSEDYVLFGGALAGEVLDGVAHLIAEFFDELGASCFQAFVHERHRFKVLVFHFLVFVDFYVDRADWIFGLGDMDGVT